MPAPRCRLWAMDAVVSSMAVDGGSRAGRAPNAAWMTSTIPAASSTDATETTRSETETLTSGSHLVWTGVRGSSPWNYSSVAAAGTRASLRPVVALPGRPSTHLGWAAGSGRSDQAEVVGLADRLGV